MQLYIYIDGSFELSYAAVFVEDKYNIDLGFRVTCLIQFFCHI